MAKLVECVPNFSEGRRPEVIDAICNAITSIDGVVLLDKEMDFDHNRAVVTFVAHPNLAVDAAFEGYKKAAELIDMTTHKGEHPRMGACDVCPFIPISKICHSVQHGIVVCTVTQPDVLDECKNILSGKVEST